MSKYNHRLSKWELESLRRLAFSFIDYQQNARSSWELETPLHLWSLFCLMTGLHRGVNNLCQCPPTFSAFWTAQELVREQEEQFAHSQPRHVGSGWKKKKTPNIQNPSLGAIMWRIPLLLLLQYPPSPFSSSLLFFFNQAVWGCQVFWDEDSQPCEKLIPCGPSSPWRSSPWEHWWWLAGRWQLERGSVKEEARMEGHGEGCTLGHPWPTDQEGKGRDSL